MTTIRPYRAGDRAACKGVFFRAVRHGAAGAYPASALAVWAPSPLPDPEQPDKLLDQWAWVAEAEGRITGFMSLRRDGYLDMAFVLPEVMGTGVAGALYEVLIAQARRAGLARLSAHASHLARPFLARRGWQVEAQDAYERDGAVLTRFAMVVVLD